MAVFYIACFICVRVKLSDEYEEDRCRNCCEYFGGGTGNNESEMN